jgi:hypothetical protein
VTYRYTDQTDDGGDHEQNPMSYHQTNGHHLKPKASTRCPSIARSILGPAHSHAHTSEVAASVFHVAIFRMDQHIDLARLVINATMTSNIATVLRKSIKPHLSPLRHTTESRHRRWGRCNLLCFRAPPASTSSKNRCPHGGEWCHTSPSFDPGDPDLGFPLELPRLGDKISRKKESS